MSGFIADNTTYNITTENEMSVILSHFDTDYIHAVIKGWIDGRFNNQHHIINNVVFSYEQNFKQLKTQYTGDLERENIEQARNEVYSDIIDLICNEFQLEFNYEEGMDLFTPAFYLFKFFVSDFNANLITFFTNFILKEKNNLYDNLNLSEFKKDKDSSTLYNKKTLKNNKLAIITSQLSYVIDNICVFDIPFDLLLSTIYADKNIINYILTIVSPKVDIFKQYFTPMMSDMSPIKPILLTDIVFQIHKVFANN